ETDSPVIYYRDQAITCIVKSYLHWLQDSDYNPVCTLCNGTLAEGDVLRLVCYAKCNSAEAIQHIALGEIGIHAAKKKYGIGESRVLRIRRGLEQPQAAQADDQAAGPSARKPKAQTPTEEMPGIATATRLPRGVARAGEELETIRAYRQSSTTLGFGGEVSGSVLPL
ncbi:hypothetical protein QZH41_017504, partial [Actinostola sp. cb2023]